MKFDKQVEARRLRSEGKSIRYITEKLCVSKSSVSVWVRDIKLTDQQKEQLTSNRSYNFKDVLSISKRELALNLRKEYQEEGKKQIIDNDLLHCMGCMLFWAEGTKHKNKISFTNSDVNMLKLFVRFLTEKLGVKNEQIVLRINCFLKEKKDITNVNNYWIEQLNLPEAKFIKPTIKLTTNTIANYGVCQITVWSTKLAQNVYGSIQAYGGFNNGMCLDNKRTRT
jgi:aspartate carbamoyltransferase regulatory subunit